LVQPQDSTFYGGCVIKKELTEAIALVRKQHGITSIMQLGSTDKLKVDVIPSGSLAVDIALGIGGFPRGRVVEIYGPESGGKTTLTLHLIAEAQKLGGECAFIDAEHAFDPVYARKLNIDTDKLLISQPDNGEQALEIAETLIKGGIDVVIIDSVAALVPRAELEGEMGDPQMGLQARMMSQALRKLTAITAKSNTCLVFINQIREKIGVMFGNPETTTGGRALKFYASIRVDIRRIGKPSETDGVKTSTTTKISIKKNKLAAPFKDAEIQIIFGEGISKEFDLIGLGVDAGAIQKNGTWLSYGGERIGQGIEQGRLFLKNNSAVRDQLEAELRKKFFNV
jgi:recombination protein RecA